MLESLKAKFYHQKPIRDLPRSFSKRQLPPAVGVIRQNGTRMSLPSIWKQGPREQERVEKYRFVLVASEVEN